MITCPKCGSPNLDQYKCCLQCGADFVSGQASQPASTGGVRCGSCGAQLPSPTDLSVLQVTCPYCGATHRLPDADWRVGALRDRQRDAERREVTRAVATSVRRGSLLGWGIGAVVLVATLAGMWPLFKASGCLPSRWDGKQPFVCTGNDEARVSGVTAKLGGTAIYATENCRLTIEDCTIDADVAIDARDNAHVILRGGTVNGRIETRANAVVDDFGARVNGALRDR